MGLLARAYSVLAGPHRVQWGRQASALPARRRGDFTVQAGQCPAAAERASGPRAAGCSGGQRRQAPGRGLALRLPSRTRLPGTSGAAYQEVAILQLGGGHLDQRCPGLFGRCGGAQGRQRCQKACVAQDLAPSGARPPLGRSILVRSAVRCSGAVQPWARLALLAARDGLLPPAAAYVARCGWHSRGRRRMSIPTPKTIKIKMARRPPTVWPISPAQRPLYCAAA